MLDHTGNVLLVFFYAKRQVARHVTGYESHLAFMG